jgi:uncharacterized membrane protein YwaF
MLIIDHFNGGFFILLAFTLLFLFGFWFIFRDRSEKTKRIAVAALYTAGFLFFFLYKYWISVDEEYSILTAAAGKGAFSWWSELPLHLCNINLALVPVAVMSKNRPLLSFAFFMAPFGAILAMMSPAVGFAGYSFFVPRMAGYYITHLLVLITAPVLAMFGLYRPKFRDIPLTILYMLGLSLIIFGINWLLRLTHLNDFANYFYNIEPEQGTPLVFFYKLIPVPFVYMIPIMFLLPVYMGAATLPFFLVERAEAKKAAAAEDEEKPAEV